MEREKRKPYLDGSTIRTRDASSETLVGLIRLGLDVELDGLTLGERSESISLDGGLVNEDIGAIVGSDEAKALDGVEELDSAGVPGIGAGGHGGHPGDEGEGGEHDQRRCKRQQLTKRKKREFAFF